MDRIGPIKKWYIKKMGSGTESVLWIIIDYSMIKLCLLPTSLRRGYVIIAFYFCLNKTSVTLSEREQCRTDFRFPFLRILTVKKNNTRGVVVEVFS